MANDETPAIVMRKENAETKRNITVHLPENLAVLYTDSAFISSSKWGIVLDFAQSITPDKQKIVSRMGMSREHAEALYKALEKELAKKNT